MAKWVKGNQLTLTNQESVLKGFPHRYTGDHKPRWINPMTPLHFASDSEWLANTEFAVNKNGQLSRRNRFCQSYPTYPNNPELRKN